MNDNFPNLRVTLPFSSDEAPDGQFTAYMHYARVQRHDGPTTAPKDWRCPNVSFLLPIPFTEQD